MAMNDVLPSWTTRQLFKANHSREFTCTRFDRSSKEKERGINRPSIISLNLSSSSSSSVQNMIALSVGQPLLHAFNASHLFKLFITCLVNFNIVILAKGSTRWMKSWYDISTRRVRWRTHVLNIANSGVD